MIFGVNFCPKIFDIDRTRITRMCEKHYGKEREVNFCQFLCARRSTMFVDAHLTQRGVDREAARLRQSVGVFQGLDCSINQREDFKNGKYKRPTVSPHGGTDSVGYSKQQADNGKAFE